MRKKIGAMTLQEMVLEMRQFVIFGTVYQGSDFIDSNRGERKAYDEILDDMEILEKEEFVEKYISILKEIKELFEAETIQNDVEIEELSGYNNAIVNVLKCINPIYEYDLENCSDNGKQEGTNADGQTKE